MMNNTNTGALTVSKLKAWARQNRDLAVAVVAAQAFHQVERERVDTYVAPIFARYDFRDEDGKAIATAERLYLSEDDDACKAFYAECDVAHREHGFAGEPGECPALVAESLKIKAENMLLESLAKFTGAPGFYTLELRAKAIKIALGACLGAK